jgi:uncharacterized membrane protein YecN with MAPEG domain
MNNLHIFSLEIFFLIIIFFKLTIGIIRIRRKERIAIGDGGNKLLARAIAAQNNFLNYVPLAIILQLTLIYLSVNPAWLILLAILLLLGRLLHLMSLTIYELKTPPTYKVRVIGMLLTFSTLWLNVFLLLGYAWF